MSLPFFSKLRNKKAYMRIVETELQKVRDAIDAQTEHFSPYMRDYMRQVCKGKGKMIRPGLVLLTAAATGGIKEEHTTFAAMLEMLKAGGDFVSEENLGAVLAWYDSL